MTTSGQIAITVLGAERHGVWIGVSEAEPGGPFQGSPLAKGVYTLLSQPSLKPELMVGAQAMASLSRAALAALATRSLSADRLRGGTLLVFGAGAEAELYARLFSSLFGVETVTVVHGNASGVGKLISTLWRSGICAAAGTPSSVQEADVVCVCVGTPDVAIDPGLLPPGVHINAPMPSSQTGQTLDSACCGEVLTVVDCQPNTDDEGHDPALRVRDGHLASSRVVGLAEVLRGDSRRTTPDEIVLFKSGGSRLADLAIARLIQRSQLSAVAG
jgi:ornithine cyclodeaminase